MVVVPIQQLVAVCHFADLLVAEMAVSVDHSYARFLFHNGTDHPVRVVRVSISPGMDDGARALGKHGPLCSATCWLKGKMRNIVGEVDFFPASDKRAGAGQNFILQAAPLGELP